MNIFVAELLGTALMILLGNGVVATCCLKNTKHDKNGNWIVITTAWAFAVFVGVIVAGPISGAHLNPAVTITFALTNAIAWKLVPQYLIGEFIGAMVGAFLVYIVYRDHFNITEDKALKRACFCTEPAIRNYVSNFISEFIATFVLIFTILHITGANIHLTIDSNANIGLGSIGALPVAILVWVLGLSLGSTTGYAMNPARDLGPRIVLFLLPLGVKPDWKYSWIPVLAPLCGGVVATLFYKIL